LAVAVAAACGLVLLLMKFFLVVDMVHQVVVEALKEVLLELF
jgi:hypothetical protein